MNVIELLQYGRKRVQRAWVKGQSINADGAVCATGAVLDTHPRLYGGRLSYQTRYNAENWLRNALRLRTQRESTSNFHSVEGYNDLSTSTKADILSLYDLAIKLASRRKGVGN